MKDFLILISPLQFPICLDTVKGDFYWIESFQKKILDMFVDFKNNYYLCHRKLA